MKVKLDIYQMVMNETGSEKENIGVHFLNDKELEKCYEIVKQHINDFGALSQMCDEDWKNIVDLLNVDVV